MGSSKQVESFKHYHAPGVIGNKRGSQPPPQPPRPPPPPPPAQLVPLWEKKYGTPAAIVDPAILSHEPFVAVLRRETWRDQFTLNRQMLPLKNDEIEKPISMFSGLLANHPPKPSKLTPFRRLEVEEMNKYVAEEKVLEEGSSTLDYCFICHKLECQRAKSEGRRSPKVEDPGVWHGHVMRTKGVYTCPRMETTPCGICGASGGGRHPDIACPTRTEPLMFYPRKM